MLLNFPGFCFPANFGPKFCFCFLSASDAGTAEGGTMALVSQLSPFPRVVLHPQGSSVPDPVLAWTPKFPCWGGTGV